MILITGIQLSNGGHGYEHIERVRYKVIGPNTGITAVSETTVAEIVEWINRGTAVTSLGHNGAPNAPVHVSSNGHRYFIESRRDSTMLNNLLSQERF
jgi:Protein of unknown function (DUF3892)